jgi:SpoVK/Ycf46/Vps4 family AAA+-type ATPase
MDTKGIVDAIRSGVSGIHIQGQDFSRIDEEVESIAQRLNFKVKEWNWGYGWVDFKTKRALKPDQEASLHEDLRAIADDDPTNKIYVIQNAYSALKNDPKAVARLQQELQRIKRCFQGQTAILLIAKEDIDFSEVIDLIVPFSCPPLASSQVEQIFLSFLEEHSITVSTAVKTSLISIFSGMERDMIFRIFETLKNNHGSSFPKEAVDDALNLKKRALSQSGLLELVNSPVSIDQVGGLEQLKSWLRNKKYIIDDLPGARGLGISAPKGVLLAGMPGCGKSMSAKATASLFNVPLLRLDIGSLMGKFVGESEANMKAALSVAEKASPCVLWIDELEKAFSGVNGSGGSTEITTRLFGYFLTWMQEKPGAVFVIATANDITTIPPELLRRGRFDEIFYIDLPSERERKQIFAVKTRQLKPPPKGLDLEELADKSDGFSGADIECVINDALEDLFRNQKLVLTQDMLKKHINLITPISVVLEEKISSYQKLFKKFSLKPASLSEEDLKGLDFKSGSSDSSERENAASNEFISTDKLVQLVKDDNSAVRQAALKNPKCPIEALQQVVDSYKSFNFGKSGSWNASEVTKKEFNLALQHPNMGGALIVDLYLKQKISSDELLTNAHKLSSQEQSAALDTAKVKLSRSITGGIVRGIRFSPGDIVKPEDILIEIDNENGSTQQIESTVTGLVTELCTQIGATIYSGDTLVKISIPKQRRSS